MPVGYIEPYAGLKPAADKGFGNRVECGCHLIARVRGTVEASANAFNGCAYACRHMSHITSHCQLRITRITHVVVSIIEAYV